MMMELGNVRSSEIGFKERVSSYENSIIFLVTIRPKMRFESRTSKPYWPYEYRNIVIMILDFSLSSSVRHGCGL